MRFAAALIVVLVMNGQANATIITGTDLIAACKTSEGPDSVCWNYIEGLSMGRAAVADGHDIYCPPKESLSVEAAKSLILGYLARHPNVAPAFAASSEFTALQQSFPCAR